MQKYYKLKDQRFLSTPSARRATQDQIHHLWRGGHFYPRPPRGGRPQRQGAADRSLYISIHALREEGDAFCRTMEPLFAIFLSTPSVRRATCSCHSRPSGSRSFLSTPSVRRATPRRSTYAATGEGFLSTPSVRRATQKRAGLYCRMEYFYPRPP